MKLIDADALKEEVNKKKVVGRFNMLLLIDNAPEINLDERDNDAFETGYIKGYDDGYYDGYNNVIKEEDNEQ